MEAMLDRVLAESLGSTASSSSMTSAAKQSSAPGGRKVVPHPCPRLAAKKTSRPAFTLDPGARLGMVRVENPREYLTDPPPGGTVILLRPNAILGRTDPTFPDLGSCGGGVAGFRRNVVGGGNNKIDLGIGNDADGVSRRLLRVVEVVPNPPASASNGDGDDETFSDDNMPPRPYVTLRYFKKAGKTVRGFHFLHDEARMTPEGTEILPQVTKKHKDNATIFRVELGDVLQFDSYFRKDKSEPRYRFRLVRVSGFGGDRAEGTALKATEGAASSNSTENRPSVDAVRAALDLKVAEMMRKAGKGPRESSLAEISAVAATATCDEQTSRPSVQKGILRAPATPPAVRTLAAKKMGGLRNVEKSDSDDDDELLSFDWSSKKATAAAVGATCPAPVRTPSAVSRRLLGSLVTPAPKQLSETSSPAPSPAPALVAALEKPSSMMTNISPPTAAATAPSQNITANLDCSAIYLAAVEHRFVSKQERFRQFQGIVKAHQNGVRGVKDVLAEITALLADHPDLLRGFACFLPNADRAKVGDRLERAAGQAEARARAVARKATTEKADPARMLTPPTQRPPAARVSGLAVALVSNVPSTSALPLGAQPTSAAAESVAPSAKTPTMVKAKMAATSVATPAPAAAISGSVVAASVAPISANVPMALDLRRSGGPMQQKLVTRATVLSTPTMTSVAQPRSTTAGLAVEKAPTMSRMSGASVSTSAAAAGPTGCVAANLSVPPTSPKTLGALPPRRRGRLRAPSSRATATCKKRALSETADAEEEDTQRVILASIADSQSNSNVIPSLDSFTTGIEAEIAAVISTETRIERPPLVAIKDEEARDTKIATTPLLTARPSPIPLASDGTESAEEKKEGDRGSAVVTAMVDAREYRFVVDGEEEEGRTRRSARKKGRVALSSPVVTEYPFPVVAATLEPPPCRWRPHAGTVHLARHVRHAPLRMVRRNSIVLTAASLFLPAYPSLI